MLQLLQDKVYELPVASHRPSRREVTSFCYCQSMLQKHLSVYLLMQLGVVGLCEAELCLVGSFLPLPLLLLQLGLSLLPLSISSGLQRACIGPQALLPQLGQ